MNGSNLIERVDRDPALGGDEKETTLTMYGQDKKFTIHSSKPTVIKSLLDHNHFELEWARVITDNGSTRIRTLEDLAESEGKIVGVTGEMPVGVLTVKSKPRANNHQSSIVNSETIDPSVFGDESD